MLQHPKGQYILNAGPDREDFIDTVNICHVYVHGLDVYAIQFGFTRNSNFLVHKGNLESVKYNPVEVAIPEIYQYVYKGFPVNHGNMITGEPIELGRSD
jgi:hypothetical protein